MQAADSLRVHFERLVIEAGKRTYALDLHRRMTVIAGVGPLEREGLITELIGGLGAGRSGVHLEIASDAGARYAIFRPDGGRHRVVDIERSTDVTQSFTTAEGLDVLRRAGIDPGQARHELCLTPSDLATRSQVDRNLHALARIDQTRLWDVAEKVTDREQHLAEVALEAGSDAEDAVLFAAIEERHREYEKAQDENERVRYLSFIAGAGGAILGIGLAAIYGLLLLVPFLALSIAATAVSISYWRRLEQARRREEVALASVGVSSYLTFQIHRVNGLLGNDQARRQMMRAAEDHRAALAEWRVLVGDIPVAWAIEHRSAIRRQAAQLRAAVAAPAPGVVPTAEDNRAELAHTLLARLSRLKSLGAGGESFPLLLDDALVDVEPAAKPELLELLTKASGNQQVIYLTEDRDVAAWARVEALTGQLAIVEPASDKPPADRAHRRIRPNIAV
jgi:hypothetical protein